MASAEASKTSWITFWTKKQFSTRALELCRLQTNKISFTNSSINFMGTKLQRWVIKVKQLQLSTSILDRVNLKIPKSKHVLRTLIAWLLSRSSSMRTNSSWFKTSKQLLKLRCKACRVWNLPSSLRTRDNCLTLTESDLVVRPVTRTFKRVNKYFDSLKLF